MCCGHSHHDHGHKEEHKHTHDHDHKKHKHSKVPPSAGAQFAYYAYNVAHTLIHVIGFKELVDHMYTQALTIKQMQAIIIEIRHCLDATRNIIRTTNALSKDLFEHYQGLEDVCWLNQAALSSDLYEFLTLLQSSTFTGDASLVSRQGNVLRAYALAQKVMPELLEKLQGIGELDTLLTCTKLIENPTNGCPFAFAEYIQDENPSLMIQGFWNPIAQWPNMIQETIALGTTHPRVAIITGANKAGKSTASAAIVLALDG